MILAALLVQMTNPHDAKWCTGKWTKAWCLAARWMRTKTAGIDVSAPRSDYSDVTRAKGRMGAQLKFSGQRRWWNL